MKEIKAVITGTGHYVPPEIITNTELVSAFNQYIEETNLSNEAEIANGKVAPLKPSTVELIEKASGIRRQ